MVDPVGGGEAGLLLQITEDSNDRLLLADPDSGLLIVRSDAPGHDRLGWGVLGSSLPVRFPECLRPADTAVRPFAVQPGQQLTPESCAVAFRLDGASGTRLGVWSPAGRQLRQFPAPEGWLAGAGLWTAGGELLLPYATDAVPCGVARMAIPLEHAAEPVPRRSARADIALISSPVDSPVDSPVVRDPVMGAGIVPDAADPDNHSTSSAHPHAVEREPYDDPSHPHMCRPVPLQQAPLATPEAP